MEQPKTFYGGPPSSQGQHLALTALHVPCSLDGGSEETHHAWVVRVGGDDGLPCTLVCEWECAGEGESKCECEYECECECQCQCQWVSGCECECGCV